MDDHGDPLAISDMGVISLLETQMMIMLYGPLSIFYVALSHQFVKSVLLFFKYKSKMSRIVISTY